MFNIHVYAVCLLSISKWKAPKFLKMKWKAYPLPLLPLFYHSFSLVFGGLFNLQRSLFGRVPNVIHNNIFKSVDITFSMQRYSTFTWCHRIQHSVYALILYIEKFFVFRMVTDNVEKYSRQIANDVHRAPTSFRLENLFWLQNATLVHRVSPILAVRLMIYI